MTVKTIFADEVQLLGWGDGRNTGPWIKLRLRESDALDAFRGLDVCVGSKTGHIFDLLLAEPETPETARHPVGVASPSATRVSRPYGTQAQSLRLSAFFRTPDVWRAIGNDAQFRAWVATQDCIATSIGEGCSGDVIAAHVRRIADGAGTGIKPAYACVPLCHGHHTEQHQHGESRLAPKEKWDLWRIQTVEKWAWETLRAELGYAHWYDVPPTVLLAWAEHACVDRYLPSAYLAAAA
jgi:hypothetical protein